VQVQRQSVHSISLHVHSTSQSALHAQQIGPNVQLVHSISLHVHSTSQSARPVQQIVPNVLHVHSINLHVHSTSQSARPVQQIVPNVQLVHSISLHVHSTSLLVHSISLLARIQSHHAIVVQLQVAIANRTHSQRVVDAMLQKISVQMIHTSLQTWQMPTSLMQLR
jgi:hypothetical protein